MTQAGGCRERKRHPRGPGGCNPGQRGGPPGAEDEAYRGRGGEARAAGRGGLELALEAGLGGPGGHPELGRLVRSGHGSRAQPGALRSLEVGTGRATARSAGAPGGPRGT